MRGLGRGADFFLILVYAYRESLLLSGAFMLLVLDIGNTHIHAGVFDGEVIQFRFRHVSSLDVSSDQFGVFLKSVLRENNLVGSITSIAIASVVPSIDYSIRHACIKYFSIDPMFVRPGIKTGLNIQTKQPKQVGADLIAGCVGACYRFPAQCLLIVDFGTATTVCAVDSNKSFKGAIIAPGVKTMMNALQLNTAQLSAVEIKNPKCVLGTDTSSAIQVGIYQSQRCMLNMLPEKIAQAHFVGQPYRVVATGGFSQLFQDEFDVVVPDLVLEGIMWINKMN